MGGKVEKLLAQEVDFDKAGLGQFYCVHCAKDFINPKAFQDHVKGKPHKRRLHALKTDPYTIEEANRAAGMGSFILPGKRKMETLDSRGDQEWRGVGGRAEASQA